MKKMTQLITESSINYDSIEDVMMRLEDIGFEIVMFNDLGGVKGVKSILFGPGNFNDVYTQMNSYSFTPDKKSCYPVYIISLSKKFHPFSNCSLYGDVVNELEVIKKRLGNCQVYYRLDITSVDGSSFDGGMYGDTEKGLRVTFHITDISTKISTKSINDRLSIKHYIDLICSTYKISEFYFIKWGISDISIRISKKYGGMDRIDGAQKVLENQLNIDKVIAGYDITTINTTNHLFISYSPK
jgi:hypothetical protein